ncbi:A-kinase anchor protein 11 isoform X2 [Triplophysa rosa]|uniref:A-kinase anchor protein 11 isoform X2 n=1 Tax=Triplophysa rosa TaxID=992332 RepID=UPI002545DE9E|nr:A-kinase anchor protein 11 isoform X2 [Triplophysa rosa]
MDACARIKGAPLKNRATMRKETIREGSHPCLKSLLKYKKELCNVVVDLHNKDTHCLSELSDFESLHDSRDCIGDKIMVRLNWDSLAVHYVCLPSLAEGENFTLQALTSLSTEMMELLRSLHVNTLKDEEILLLKDPKRPFERKDNISQHQAGWSRALCILRHSSSPQISVCTMLGLLARYTAGIRYALELQVLQRGTSEACQAEDDDTNQSVSSIEEDFVTAFEHLEEEDTGAHSQRNNRDVASQTLPSHSKELSGSCIIISSISKKTVWKEKASAQISESVQKSTAWAEDSETVYTPSGPPKGRSTSTSLTESDESDCSSPSPIIFLDEVGYQKSLKAKLDIPKIPVLKEGVEDSDSEVSEFFDSFDQFDELDQSFDYNIKGLKEQPLPGQEGKKHVATSGCKLVSRGCSTTAMNPHKFDHRILPANVKKPTPLKPGSPYSIHSDAPDSPRPPKTPCDENGLFSPVRSSAFSPLADGGSLEYFWKADGDSSELRKPHDLCSLYKTYSDFANNLSKEILGSVCGYSSPVDFNINKNLSCVCHKEFQNTNGHLMKLSDIQETVTITKTQSQSLKDGIQKFAADLVEMSIGSALRDLQKGVSSCTTTVCHLAAKLTSSVFQMAFHEIGMRHAYVLKERAINGLASFVVGEAISGALKEFLFVKKQIFNNTVARFAADLAEELVFEGIMEVCQFSHPSTPLTPSDWSFEQEEEVVSSYASDLSESVLQEAFIELSQADVTFTTQAAISVSVDNICYVSAEVASLVTNTCSAQTSYLGSQAVAEAGNQEHDGCTVKKALYCVSGMVSCVPVPVAGKVISHVRNSEEPTQCKSSIGQICETSPKRTICCQGKVTTFTSDTSAATQTKSLPGLSRNRDTNEEQEIIGSSSTESNSGKPSIGKTFQNFSGNVVDSIVGEAFDLMHSSTKVKKKVEDCADFLSKTIAAHISTPTHGNVKSQDAVSQSSQAQKGLFHLVSKGSCDTASRSIRPVSKPTSEVRSVIKMDTLEVPSFDVSPCSGRKVGEDIFNANCVAKLIETPSTPPSSPQQPLDENSEKQVKQFSKKLKGKLAKEFSPATPPPTPYYPPATDFKETGSVSDKADFMLKLIRSLSEEAGTNEDEEEDQEDVTHSRKCQSELSPNVRNRMVERGALHYAERLACHIVSMATEMDTLSFGDVKKPVGEDSKGSVASHSAQFSEQTLNSLWTYAGEVAGEVINDVKRMVSSTHCRHKTTKRGSANSADKRQSEDYKDGLLGGLAYQWSGDVQASVQNSQSGGSSGMSSDYPSCESVTDEYAGYLIKVLKKEGGSRELILDQYATRLAYRSIKSGLAHAAQKIKQRSPLRLHSYKRLHSDHSHGISQIPISKSSHCVLSHGTDGSSCESLPCAYQDGQEISSSEYVELVNFAESLAYNITCDVTRKLRMSSVRLPKSLTDSCLYRKSNVEDMPEHQIKTMFSGPLLPYTETNRLYHSTGSLNDGKCNNGIMQVIEHYARKIVDDTLEMTLGPACFQAAGDRRALEPNSFTEKLAKAYESCRYCQGRDCLFCSRDGRRLSFQGLKRRRKQESDAMTGLEIPRIHIDLDKRTAFAEGMVSGAVEKAKKELSCTSLNADSGIGHDGASFAESLTTEIMTSALSNVCQTINLGSPRREGVNVTESTVSQQLSLSVGDDSLGSWSNLSFEEDHPDESSSFHHLSDSNGNSSSWSSLGLEGEVYEEHLSFSPSDSDYTEEKEAEAREASGSVRVEREAGQAERALLVASTDVWGRGLDPQLTAVLQWIAVSIAELPLMQLSHCSALELQQLPAVAQRLRERKFRVGDLLQALLRYFEEHHGEEDHVARGHKNLFEWLLEQA